MNEQQKFTIIIRGKQYSVELREDNYLHTINYSISTDCNYLMTVYKNDQGSWVADGEVQVMDDSLVNEIGSAIEMQGWFVVSRFNAAWQVGYNLMYHFIKNHAVVRDASDRL